MARTVTCNGKSDVSALAGKPIRLRSLFRNAKLYALQSEAELQAELDLTRRAGAGHAAESSCVDPGAGSAECRVVERVEELRPELNLAVFAPGPPF